MSRRPRTEVDAAPPATATQRVYDGIWTAILEHRLAPGSRLREEELAESFAVSRTVVRQALNRLAQDQVIELRHNVGAQVPQPTRETAAHVFDARRVVECEVARRLAGQLDAAQLQQLQALVQQAMQLHQQGRLDEADACYARVPADGPQMADALHLRFGISRPILADALDALGIDSGA